MILKNKKALFFLPWIALYVFLYFFFGALRFPMQQNDERHFWLTCLDFSKQIIPSIELLKSYNELNTPLPFYIFGTFENIFRGGIVFARHLNYAFSLVLIVVIAKGARGKLISGALCAAGLLIFPYFLFVSIYCYTDILGAWFVLLGTLLYLSNKPLLSLICFVLAISSRQYLVAFPAGLLLYELTLLAKNKFQRIWPMISLVLACLSLCMWCVFWGDVAPSVTLHKQNFKTNSILPCHGLYFLSCLGLYYVLLESILFRSLAPFENIKKDRIVVALFVAAAFIFIPWSNNANYFTDQMGLLDRVSRLVNNDFVRIVLLAILAILTCLRFSICSLPGALVFTNAFLMVKSSVMWDKYLTPLLIVLWFLKSRDYGKPESNVLYSEYENV